MDEKLYQEVGGMNEAPDSSEGKPIRVAIVEDDRLARDWLHQLLDGTPGYCCTNAFESVERGLHEMAKDVPDVLLLDIHLPGMSGTEGVRLFREKFQKLQVLMLTNYSEEDKVFESIYNGACGYLLKQTPPEKLLEAISDAATGGAPMSPGIARMVVELFQKTKPPVKVEHALTPHEVRLLGILAQGYTYQGVADMLSVSINTIRTYIRSIYEKLHVHSKSEAISKALRGRII